MTGRAIPHKAKRRRGAEPAEQPAGKRRWIVALAILAALVLALAAGGYTLLANTDSGGLVVVEGKLTPSEVETEPPSAEVATGSSKALAEAFELTPGQTVEACATADVADTLCYIPFLMNLEDGRFVYLVGAPFSEVFAWALVEEQPDGIFEATETADYDFEGDGTPPFALDGPLAGLVFTSAVQDELPTDRIDDGNSPMPAGATEMAVFLRYTGLGAFDSATVVIERDGVRVGEPSTIVVAPGGAGTGSVVLGLPGGEVIPAGAYKATVILEGHEIAEARAAVQGE